MSSNIFYLICGSFLVAFFFYERSRKKRSLRLINELKEAREQLQHYADNLNNLISMLVGIHEFGVEATSFYDMDKVCQVVVANACRLLRTGIGSLMLLNKENNLLEIEAAQGLPPDVIKSSVRIGEGVAGLVAKLGEPIFCEDIETDPRFQRENRMQYNSKSFVSVPLKVKDRVIGVLNINNKESGHPFNQRDLRLLTILADQAAITIENVQLYQDMRNLYIGTIKTLAHAIEAKDPYTRGHAERVTQYAVAIAEEMALPKTLIRNIETAGLIHDIGKIGIKDEILTKQGKLSSVEYEVIKTHPLIGERIVRPIGFLENVTPLILYHHERYDGKGFLEGLKGKEIPLGSRILNVADAYDAMITDRPYRKAMSKEKAQEELKRCSGSQFDPEVIEAFLRVLKRWEREGREHNPEVREEEIG